MQRSGTVGRRALPRLPAARWLLLVAVVAGLIGMHVLTGGDTMEHHAGLPTRVAAGTSVDHTVPMPMAYTVPATPVSAAASVHPTPGPTDVDPGSMAGCILFLTAAAGALLAAVLARRRTPPDPEVRPGTTGEHPLWRRGPPQWPHTRLALGVFRI